MVTDRLPVSTHARAWGILRAVLLRVESIGRLFHPKASRIDRHRVAFVVRHVSAAPMVTADSPSRRLLAREGHCALLKVGLSRSVDFVTWKAQSGARILLVGGSGGSRGGKRGEKGWEGDGVRVGGEILGGGLRWWRWRVYS